MPRRKQDRPKRMKYSEDGKEEECDADTATGEEEDDDDIQDDGDAESDSRSDDAKPAGEATDKAEASTAEMAEVASPSVPSKSPEEHVELDVPDSVVASASALPKDSVSRSCPPAAPPPPPPESQLSPTVAAVASSPANAKALPQVSSPSLPLLLPSLKPSKIERPTPLLPDEPIEELAIRPLSSLENMSKAIEQKIPSVFEKYQAPRVKEAVKLPYKPSKVIREMPSRSQQHPSSSSASHKSKDRMGTSSKGQCVPPSMTRHVAPTSSRPAYSASKSTMAASEAYVDSDQPLDLSKKPKSGSPHKASHGKASKAQYQYTPLPPSNSTSISTGSSLSNLEKRFGGNSFLFDGTSGKLNAPKNPLYQAFGGNLFATALYNTPPLASTDQVYRPHYRNYWPGPIPAPRHAPKPLSSAASSATNSKSHHHENSKNSSSDHHASSRKDMDHLPGIGVSSVSSGIGANGKYTNLICSCKKEFETLYELTIHMQSTSHTPLPCKNGDQGEYPKLVRGQDMWLNQGMEQTRQILRCMQCGESFKSLPELTIHMMKTRHYTNIVGAESRKIHKYTSYYSDNEEEDRGSVFCCKVCHESFKDMDGLANHMVVSGHHKKHVLKNSSHGSSSSSGVGEARRGHDAHQTSLTNHDAKSQSPKPAGIPVAPSNLAHSFRTSKSPTATVATLLESQRILTNGTKTDNLTDRQTPDRKRKHSSSSSSQVEEWKTKLIKTEKSEETACVSPADKRGRQCGSEELVKDCRTPSDKDYRKTSEVGQLPQGNSSCSDREAGSLPLVDKLVIKSERPDSATGPDNDDDDDDDSMKDDLPEMNKIRCENCGERIETPSFVEHVRACVKLTPEEACSLKEGSAVTAGDTALNLKRYSHLDSPNVERPHPLEYIPYKKRGRYEEAALKVQVHQRPKSMEAHSYSPRNNKMEWSKSNPDTNLGIDMSKVKDERPGSPFGLGMRIPYPERPKSQDVNLHREHRKPERPRSEGSERLASMVSEPLRPWSMGRFDRLGPREYPRRPHSNEEQPRPRTKEYVRRPMSTDAILESRSYECFKAELLSPGRKPSIKEIVPERPRSREQWSPGRPSLHESCPPSSLSPLRARSPVLHSTTGSMLLTLSESSGSSALKAMENFIERSFITNSNKPSFYRSNPMNGRMSGLSMGGLSRLDCPLPDSTAQHVEAYSAQHKYLPPSLPTNLKVEKPESQKESSRHHSPKVKVEGGEADESLAITSAAKSNGKSDDAGSSDNENVGNGSSPKPLHQKYLADGGSPQGEKSSSALQSLQGLVYGKSFSTEHPLDSLQKLIHNTNTPTSIARPNGLQQTYVTGMATLQQQSLPSTVILVNPIVTVMPNSSSSASTAVHINISRDTSPPLTGQCSPSSSTPSKNSPVSGGTAAVSYDLTPEVGGDQSGDFRCQACNRTFASKGSYRYHLSRCHLSSVKRCGIKEAFNMSPYVYLPLDHTAKFNGYCEMANELANKGK